MHPSQYLGLPLQPPQALCPSPYLFPSIHQLPLHSLPSPAELVDPIIPTSVLPGFSSPFTRSYPPGKT